ncbi:MAG TPA: alkaline phosphatase D family protein, partial [Segetibacter sp.]
MLDRRKFIKDTSLTTGAIVSASLLPFIEIKDPGTDLNTFFQHGVASGDPLATQVIIWTRITPEKAGDCMVKWAVSKDNTFTQIAQSGEVITNVEKDYTVKIDVTGLSPSNAYFYHFTFQNTISPVGKTKTTPINAIDKLHFAVVSCSDYAAGFYNAYANIADRKDLNAIIHLGDYIYEGTKRDFDPHNNNYDDSFEATHFNRTKEWWLHYYRSRYALSRLDPDLQAAHGAYAFICIWDDHETANNTWKNGADGHNDERDGDWETRKSAAKQAYSEWIPIRGNALKIYRSIRFGNLAELILLDTRLEGRDKQIYDTENPGLFAKERTLLGKEQKEWLFTKFDNSPCQWKLMANQ